MGVFKDMLGAGESLFLNPVALDFDYHPKVLLYREREQRTIAAAIKPLFTGRTGRNLFIYGQPGLGKTIACRHVLQELEEQTDEIHVLYINCWQKNTTFKILVEICEQLGYKFTQNKNTEQLLVIIKNIINKSSAVFAFDEADKLEDVNFIYTLIEHIFKKAIILITNDKNWLVNLDDRVKSRLIAEMLEFRPYSEAEIKGILKTRADFAFVKGVLDPLAFDAVCRKTFELKDVRAGLYLLREAGNAAEERSSKKITIADVEMAIAKLEEFKIKDIEALEEDMRMILGLIKNNSGDKIGELYRKYSEAGGKAVYKTFQRKIEKLSQGKYIETEKIPGGAEGKTTIVRYASEKKLSEF
ncbi:MAG TPA: AAA family ATPase [Candidatus Nanoarchaeia archaeon]|nr:AAA family ATPase [Candidatus Nanoarchaeia archaeon]